MTNRLLHLLGPPDKSFRLTDLYEVDTLRGPALVSFRVARAIVRALDKSATPDWIEFEDVFGVKHTLPALYVYRITYQGDAPANEARGLLSRKADPSLRSG